MSFIIFWLVVATLFWRDYFGGFWCYFNLEFSHSRLYNDTKPEQMFEIIRRLIEFRLAEEDYIEDLC